MTAGKFVTQRGNELTLYDSDLKELKKTELPSASTLWVSNPSRTGNHILFVGFHPDSALVSWVWLETGTLHIIRSWNAQPRGYVSITDNRIALSTWCTSIGCEPTKLEIRGLSTNWTVIGLGDRRPFFVDKDKLFLPSTGNPTRNSPALLIRTNGEIIFSDKQPAEGGVWWKDAIRSTDGRRFVVPGVRTEGGSDFLDISGHNVLKQILVYDLTDEGGHHYVLDVKGPKIKGEMKFALSPDGTRLAVLNNETVEMFDLPPVQ